MKLIEIKNGNLNNVFKLETTNKDYIIRFSNFDNKFESVILKILEKYKINAPRLKTRFIIDGKYIMICDYINGDNPINYDFNFFQKLIIEIKKLHNIEINNLLIKNDNFESFDKLKEYYNVSINSKFLIRECDFINDIMSLILRNLKLDILPQSLIHSDIKRENLLIDEEKVYLIDFGNCYFGSRLIEIIRLYMWFFIRENNYDINMMKKIKNLYFDENNPITKIEIENIELLLIFCLLYNLLKDIYLYEIKLLPEKYILKNSLKWLEVLKNKEELSKIMEVFNDAKRFTK